MHNYRPLDKPMVDTTAKSVPPLTFPWKLEIVMTETGGLRSLLWSSCNLFVSVQHAAFTLWLAIQSRAPEGLIDEMTAKSRALPYPSSSTNTSILHTYKDLQTDTCRKTYYFRVWRPYRAFCWPPIGSVSRLWFHYRFSLAVQYSCHAIVLWEHFALPVTGCLSACSIWY